MTMTDHELLQALYDDMRGMKDDMQDMKNDIQMIKRKVSDIELHIENVTYKNIQAIAEGHFNLNRKLDEALKVESEKEMLIIRVNILEDEIRKIKERLAQIA